MTIPASSPPTQLMGHRIFNKTLIVLSFAIALLTLTAILRQHLNYRFDRVGGFIKIPIGLQVAMHTINTFVALLSFFGVAIFHPMFSYKFSPDSQMNHQGPAEKFRGAGLVCFALQFLQWLGNCIVLVYFIRMAVYADRSDYEQSYTYVTSHFYNIIIAVIVIHPILVYLIGCNLMSSYYRMLYAPSSPVAPPTAVSHDQMSQLTPYHSSAPNDNTNPYSPFYPSHDNYKAL